MISNFLMWLVDNVPMGRLAPYVFGLALGRWPHRVEGDKGKRAWKVSVGNWDVYATFHGPKEWLTWTGWTIDVDRGMIWLDLVVLVVSSVRERWEK